VATGQKASFFNRERKIVLTGSPKVYQDDDFVEGDEITVLLDEERSIVKSEQGSRVNAVFHPKGDKP
jgi:lipopolysaccharide export system protein LptA